MRLRASIIALLAIAVVILSTVTASADEYTVKRGDTLSHIAQHYDTTWPEIFELNRKIIDNPDLIYPGQVLAVDGKQAKPKKKAKHKPAPEVTRPATGAITSPYGMRTHPITGVRKLHAGTDFAAGDGNAYAAKAGEVTGAGWVDWAGNLVTVDHGGGTVSRYAHLASTAVGVGEQVSAGQVVGRIGSTGWSTGPHLHFEVLINGEHVNPMGWLDGG